jgi:NADPH:quinone reductase-like Zn-dependent oxidoreductase
MKAIVQEEYGSLDALQLREVEKPAPGDDEVLVRVRAASVHPDVWHVVCGRPYVLRLMGAGFPRPKNPIPGTDMAGAVEALGTLRRPPASPRAVSGRTAAGLSTPASAGNSIEMDAEEPAVVPRSAALLIWTQPSFPPFCRIS